MKKHIVLLIILFVLGVHNAVSAQIEETLGFPLEGMGPFDPAIIISVMDLESPRPYLTNRIVEAYSGETGRKRFGEVDRCYRMDESATEFQLSGNYGGDANGPTYLCYDGHVGVDFRVNGHSVIAVADGSVTRVENDFPDSKDTDCKCLGNLVIIDHGGGWSSVYGHLKKDSAQRDMIPLKVGDSVRQGEQIGVQIAVLRN